VTAVSATSVTVLFRNAALGGMAVPVMIPLAIALTGGTNTLTIATTTAGRVRADR